jgi:hypothetical protein
MHRQRQSVRLPSAREGLDPAYVKVVSAAKDVVNDADHLNDFCIIDSSPLHYNEVNVEGIDGKMSALEDGGTEIAVIKASCLPIHHYDVVGTVKLRGIVGVPVTADVEKLHVSLADDVDNSLTVICAVCEEANEDLILPSNVVERLYKMLHDKMKDDPVDNSYSDECILDRVDCCNVVHYNVNVAHGSVTKIGDGFTFTYGSDDSVTRVNGNESDVDKLITEQRNDDTLKTCFDMASRGKSNYLMRDGLLYRREKLFGQDVEVLVIPLMRLNLLHLAHDTAHQAMRKTRDRIRASLLTWPTLSSDCRHYASHCCECQMKARATCYDSAD